MSDFRVAKVSNSSGLLGRCGVSDFFVIPVTPSPQKQKHSTIAECFCQELFVFVGINKIGKLPIQN